MSLPSSACRSGQRGRVVGNASPLSSSSQPPSITSAISKQARKELEQVQLQERSDVRANRQVTETGGQVQNGTCSEQADDGNALNERACAASEDAPESRPLGASQTTVQEEIDRNGENEPPLPILPPFNHIKEPKFQWGSLQGEDFFHVIRCAYAEIVQWKRNVFLVPTGKQGKEFVKELTSLFTAFAQASALESIALDAVMVCCALLLQKPHCQSKSRDHVAALERRLRAWRTGDIDGLLREGRTIQGQLRFTKAGRQDGDDDANTKVFTKLVLEGNIHAALRYLSDNRKGGVLSLDEYVDDRRERTVREVLHEKHPSPRELHASTLVSVTDDPPTVHPVYFDRITGSVIRAAALRTRGVAGPSGVDATGWRRLCTAFHKESADLCEAVAAFTRRICTEFVDPEGLRAFTSCRLIPLDKSPGVRPIGISEVIRRIVGKAIMRVVKDDVLAASGPLQLCGGHEAGSESAVHAMRAVFDDPDTDAVILVDAKNAFNNLNRKAALINIRYLCPAIAVALINCYRDEASLFVGGETLFSREGTTQGDPLAMSMFALATVPLINAVATKNTTQAWFADDSGCGGKLQKLRKWWDRLQSIGPTYGYFPNPIKTSLVVKQEKLDDAVQVFGDTQVQITTVGRRYLGGCIGTKEYSNEVFNMLVQGWTTEVKNLTRIAQSQPHASYAAFTHGLIGRWVYHMRVMRAGGSDCLQGLEDAISHLLLPAFTGQPPPSATVRAALALPARQGGLGIVNPIGLIARQQQASIMICGPVIKLIVQQGGDIIAARHEQQVLKNQLSKQRREACKVEAAACISELPHDLKRGAVAAQEPGASSWLSAVPVKRHGFALHKGAFRDALCLRYGWRPALLPQTCQCGIPFDISHALICRYGGFPSQRHNELRDLTASLMGEVCSNVCTEPVLQSLSGEQLPTSANADDNARLDVRARGFWDNTCQDAFFDVRVVYPFASSYAQKPLTTVYREHERKKKAEYGRRVREIEHGCFTPLIFTTSGGIAPEATVTFKRLASLIAEKKKETYSSVMGWIRCKISFCLLRSSLLCLRGSRSKPNVEDSTMAEAIAEGRLPR